MHLQSLVKAPSKPPQSSVSSSFFLWFLVLHSRRCLLFSHLVRLSATFLCCSYRQQECFRLIFASLGSSPLCSSAFFLVLNSSLASMFLCSSSAPGHIPQLLHGIGSWRRETRAWLQRKDFQIASNAAATSSRYSPL